jgi:hypothetical protein
MPITSLFGHWATPTTSQTGSYTVQTRDFGSVIKAPGALTATLPPPGPALNGVWVKFFSTAAGDLVVTTAGGDAIVTDADAAADSVTYGTAGEEIGASCMFLCDGTSWLHFNYLSGVTSSKAQAT